MLSKSSRGIWRPEPAGSTLAKPLTCLRDRRQLYDPCTTGEEFADRRFRDLRMHPGYILADRIVQAKLSLLAKLHKPSRDEAFGVRRDTKSVAGSELFFRDDISVADCSLEYDLISVRDREDTAGLL